LKANQVADDGSGSKNTPQEEVLRGLKSVATGGVPIGFLKKEDQQVAPPIPSLGSLARASHQRYGSDVVLNRAKSVFRQIPSITPLVLFSGLSSGCAESVGEQPARAPERPLAYIAQPCATLKEQPPTATPVEIFFEVADIVQPAGAPMKDWLATHPVEVHHVAKFSIPVTANTPIQVPFGTCLDQTCSKTEDATLVVNLSRAPTDASAPVELELNLSTENGPPRQLSVKTTDQEPVRASLTTPPEQTVVVMPYYLFGSKSHGLQLLVQCASQSEK
jgi:hypothetical protein